jgi:hypothetical protein
MYGESKKRFTAAVRSTCSHCVRFVASLSYSTDISVKVPREMKVALSLNTFSATQFVAFKFLKNVTAECVDNFFVLGCYMLHHLVSSNELAEFCALSIVRARLSEV